MMKIKLKQIKLMKKQLKEVQELIKSKNFCTGINCDDCPLDIKNGFSREDVCYKSKIFDAVDKTLNKLYKAGGGK